MYINRRILIGKSHVLHPYFDGMTRAANNLYNAALFRIRQVMTAVNKDPKQWTCNETEIWDEITDNLSKMNASRAKPFEMPSAGKWLLSYYFLDCLFKVSGNPDYFALALPRHSAQHVIRSVCRNMKAFFAASRSYAKDPAAFTGKPKLPFYKKSGGNATAILSNQECVLHPDADGAVYAKLPRTGERLCIGQVDPSLRLKQVTVTPFHGVFIIGFVLDDGKAPAAMKPAKRICAIDIGVDNIAAITNNIGKECLLFKGGVIKSANQWYNKRMADIMSKQTKGGTARFVPTEESDALLIKRDNQIRDFMYKVSKSIVKWCVKNEIDTIVVGTNKFWKQQVNIGKVNNQQFVQIPFDMLRRFLQYRAEQAGIRYIAQEESYTSKASFLDSDPIPVYGKTSSPSFSGKRRPIWYKGMRSKSGFRGLYTAKDGTIINSDLNGSANIGRKALHEFDMGTKPNFTDVVVIKHPDLKVVPLG